MQAAIAGLGHKLSVGQIHNDFKEGAPRVSARAFIAWRAAFRELGRTADSRIDRPQASAPNTTPGRGGDLPQGQAPAGEEPDSSPATSDDESASTDGETAEWRTERVRSERVRADRGELELRRMRGQLVDRKEAEDLQFTSQRITRDRVLMVPARGAAELHALLQSSTKLEAHTIERLLETWLRTALDEASKAIEELGRDDDDDDDTTGA